MTQDITVTVWFLMNGRIREQLLEAAQMSDGTEVAVAVRDARKVTIEREDIDLWNAGPEQPRWHTTTTIRPLP